MSRLQAHHQKQLYFQLVFYIALLIVVLVLVFTFGIKFLINSSLFVNSLNKSSSLNESSRTSADFIGTFRLDSPENATNEAKILVTGAVLNYDKVEIYLNDEMVKEFSPDSDTFSEEIGDLMVGKNTVYAIARANRQNRSKTSETYSVVYKNTKPKLEITEPQDQTKTNSPEIKISGSTDPEVFIRVNNLPVVVDAQNHFQTSLRLNDGENKIEVIAEDIVGNQEKKTLTVIYQKEG